jgi:hypothetical protein
MSASYYQLIDDPTPDRWYLKGLWDKAGRKLDPRDFRYGDSIEFVPSLRVHSEDGALVEAKFPLRTGLRKNGSPLDFTFASFDMPIVRGHVARLLCEIDEPAFQVFPVAVDGYSEDFFILNVCRRLECIDREKSDAEWWNLPDCPPDKVGKPSAIFSLVVDRELAQPYHAFRVADWEIALVVSDRIRLAFQQTGVRGVRFQEV